MHLLSITHRATNEVLTLCLTEKPKRFWAKYRYKGRTHFVSDAHELPWEPVDRRPKTALPAGVMYWRPEWGCYAG